MAKPELYFRSTLIGFISIDFKTQAIRALNSSTADALERSCNCFTGWMKCYAALYCTGWILSLKTEHALNSDFSFYQVREAVIYVLAEFVRQGGTPPPNLRENKFEKKKGFFP